MQDLVLFDSKDSDGIMRKNISGAQKGILLTSDDIDRARIGSARAKYLHLTTYQADIGLVRTCAQNGCKTIIALSDLLGLPAYEMAKRIGRMRRLIRISLHFGAPLRLSTLAKNEYQLRNEGEMIMFAEMLGLSAKQAIAMLKEDDGEQKD